jgi:hypothetical protein
MATPVKPNKHTALKKDAWWLVPAVADSEAPKVTEINAAGGIYATCFLLQDQGGVTKTVNKTTLAALLCEDSTSEALSPSSFSMSDIVGAFDPQAGPTDADKKLFEFLRDGFDGFAVRRQNVINDASDLAVIDQYVDIVPVSIDSSWPDKSAAGPEGFYTFTSGVAVTGIPVPNVKVVAGP